MKKEIIETLESYDIILNEEKQFEKLIAINDDNLVFDVLDHYFVLEGLQNLLKEEFTYGALKDIKFIYCYIHNYFDFPHKRAVRISRSNIIKLK